MKSGLSQLSTVPSHIVQANAVALGVLAVIALAGIISGHINKALPMLGIAAIAAIIAFAFYYFRQHMPGISMFVLYFMPLIAYPVLYEPTHALMTATHPGTVDAGVLAIDTAIFGVNPIRALYEIQHPLLTDFAYLSYFSYYLGMPVLLILMFAKNSRRDFEKVLLVMTTGWYGALLSYLLFPALGPQRFMAGELPQLYGALPTTGWIQAFLAQSLTPAIRDCVPSMHTAITILTLIYAFKYHRGFFRAYLIPGVGLIFATMYTQQHYVTDVILGVFAAVLLYWCCETLYARKAPQSQTVLIDG